LETLADQSNRAYRVLDLTTGDLVTLVGHPERKEFQPGRIPAGSASGGPYGAVGEPRDIGFSSEGPPLPDRSEAKDGSERKCAPSPTVETKR
jgi:hypothetical protein